MSSSEQFISVNSINSNRSSNSMDTPHNFYNDLIYQHVKNESDFPKNIFNSIKHEKNWNAINLTKVIKENSLKLNTLINKIQNFKNLKNDDKIIKNDSTTLNSNNLKETEKILYANINNKNQKISRNRINNYSDFQSFYKFNSRTQSISLKSSFVNFNNTQKNSQNSSFRIHQKKNHKALQLNCLNQIAGGKFNFNVHKITQEFKRKNRELQEKDFLKFNLNAKQFHQIDLKDKNLIIGKNIDPVKISSLTPKKNEENPPNDKIIFDINSSKIPSNNQISLKNKTRLKYKKILLETILDFEKNTDSNIRYLNQNELPQKEESCNKTENSSRQSKIKNSKIKFDQNKILNLFNKNSKNKVTLDLSKFNSKIPSDSNQQSISNDIRYDENKYKIIITNVDQATKNNFNTIDVDSDIDKRKNLNKNPHSLLIPNNNKSINSSNKNFFLTTTTDLKKANNHLNNLNGSNESNAFSLKTPIKKLKSKFATVSYVDKFNKTGTTNFTKFLPLSAERNRSSHIKNIKSDTYVDFASEKNLKKEVIKLLNPDKRLIFVHLKEDVKNFRKNQRKALSVDKTNIFNKCRNVDLINEKSSIKLRNILESSYKIDFKKDEVLGFNPTRYKIQPLTDRDSLNRELREIKNFKLKYMLNGLLNKTHENSNFDKIG